MQHQFKAIVRLARYKFRPLIFVRSYNSGEKAPRVVATKVFDATSDANMGKDKAQFLLKTPKGTKDCEAHSGVINWLGINSNIYPGEDIDMVIRDKIFSSITSVFKRHGAITIDTYALCLPHRLNLLY